MRLDLDFGLEPPSPLPKVQRQPRKGEPIKSRRPLIKGRIRSSAIAFVSPKRTKGRRTHWRVRYSRNGVHFDQSWESRLLCCWIARLIHRQASPELIGKYSVIGDNFVWVNQKWPDLASPLWIHDTEEPTVIAVDTSKFDLLNVPWFKVKRHRWFVSPVVTIDENKKVIISWMNLGHEVSRIPMEELRMKDPPFRNNRGQIVMDWSHVNLFRTNK